MDTAHAPVRIALLGYGTIGSALHRVLVEHRDHIRHATGRDVEVVAALVRDARRPRAGIAGARMALLDDAEGVWAQDVQLVCEAMGGTSPAREYVLEALRRGIPVVTANKQLIARHGAELFEAAAASGTQLRFEASVCGAIPIVRALRESLAAARITRVLGILNGTTNFILTAMAETGATYGAALADAQRLGYAEPDPSDDVGGVDAAAKLAILAGIAFHTRVGVEDVATTGIEGISADDVGFAGLLGGRIRLLGRAELVDGQLRAEVAPMLVPAAHPLANVAGSTNAVLVNGAPFSELLFEGPGAGGPETASALAGDIVGVLGSMPSFLTRDPQLHAHELSPADLRAEPCYVRLRVPDRPGALAAVAGAFADRGVSIERLVQQRSVDDVASLVLTTHPAPRRAVREAIIEVAGDGDWTLLPILAAGDPETTASTRDIAEERASEPEPTGVGA